VQRREKLTLRKLIIRWLPAVLLMAVIFVFSSIPSNELPDFDWADRLVKKGGHALGYGLLALSYARGLRSGILPETAQGGRRRYLAAFLLAVLYSVLDEFHQSFTPGRHPSPWDVLIDSGGAALALLLARIPLCGAGFSRFFA
jgi:VanZ family protein